MLDSNQFKPNFIPTAAIYNILENARQQENVCFLKATKFFI